MAAHAAGRHGDASGGAGDKIPLTRQGYEELRARLDHLLTERRQRVAEYLHEAKEPGDVMESGAYEDAKQLQALVEGEIRELRRILDHAVILETGEPAAVGRAVRLGTTVEVETPRGPKTLTLVSTVEADPAQAKISDESPVGRALLGHREGDRVEVATPGGLATYMIRAIRPYESPQGERHTGERHASHA